MSRDDGMTRWLRRILLAKLIIVSAVVFGIYGGVHIGDLPSFAAGDTKPAEAQKKVSAEPVPEAAKNNEESSVAPARVDEDGYQEAERPKVVRKTFLDELFDLPEIDPNAVKNDEVNKYLALVERKKQEVVERLSLLQAREQRLNEIERVIEEKLRRLDEERRYFGDTVQQEKKLGDERVTQLVAFYKKMPAKTAAPVFEKLDKDLIVQLFDKMPEKQVTEILGLMNPDTSVKLSEYYGRVRSGKEYELLKEINKSLTDEFQNCKTTAH